jgi:hypothetical protein
MMKVQIYFQFTHADSPHMNYLLLGSCVSNKTILITHEFYMEVEFQQCVCSPFFYCIQQMELITAEWAVLSVATWHCSRKWVAL